ncbi:MAG: hypothetical protein ABEJ78_03335 [Haloferacaceae archaeon]
MSYLVELAFIGGIPLLVFVGGFAPAALNAVLTVHSDSITLGALFGHWLVHFSRLGATQNAVGLVTAGLFAGGLALAQGDSRWFRFSYATLLVVVPVATVVVDALVLPMLLGGAYRTRGASAIVAAVLGIGFAAVVRYVCRSVDVRGAVTAGGVVIVGSLLVVLDRSGVGDRPIALLGSLLAVVVMGDVVARIRAKGQLQISTGALTVWLVILVSSIVLATAFVFLFPANPFAGPTITNVLSHASGFVGGTVIGVWGYRYWAADSWW